VPPMTIPRLRVDDPDRRPLEPARNVRARAAAAAEGRCAVRRALSGGPHRHLGAVRAPEAPRIEETLKGHGAEGGSRPCLGPRSSSA